MYLFCIYAPNKKEKTDGRVTWGENYELCPNEREIHIFDAFGGLICIIDLTECTKVDIYNASRPQDPIMETILGTKISLG